jgi:hypothetical protein
VPITQLLPALLGQGGGGNSIVAAAEGSDDSQSQVPSDSATSTPATSTPDITPPVIAAQADISVVATSSDSTFAVVSYATPTATDDTDGTDAVSCTPTPGSNFDVGTTTVTCTASDVAGNMSSTTFNVGVTTPAPSGPTPGSTFVMASQPDQSYLCSPDWRTCYTGGAPEVLIPLGSGADFQTGTLSSITITKEDDTSGTGVEDSVAYPWTVGVVCFVDSAYITPCDGNAFTTAQTTQSTDNIHWSAPFDFNFDSDDYYELYINEGLVPISSYGTPTEPYWVMTGIAK